MKVRIAVVAGIALFAVTGLILASNLECSEHVPPAVHSPPAPAVTPMQYRGLAIQVQSGWKPVERFVPLIRQVADLGANTVLLITAGFMEHAESQSIFIDARKTPSPEEFKTIIRQTRAMGLKVILMPIVLLSKPRGSEWRGVIDPPDWDEWWHQYHDFIVYFCEIARDGGANALMVGSELISAEKYTDRWLEIIATAREQFYGGQLGYSANWDHYRSVKFWDQLDFIGMTSYFTLAEDRNPSVDEIVAHWEPIREEVLKWQREVGKPLVFTEVGWCSQEGAATAPWNYYNNQKATSAGLEEQRRLYQAFLKVWDGQSGVAGAIWWEWSFAQGGPDDYGYTPKGKPAEQILRQWFAEYAPTTSPATAPTGGSRAPAPSPHPPGH